MQKQTYFEKGKNRYIVIFMILTLLCSFLFFSVSRGMLKEDSFCQDTYLQAKQDSIASRLEQSHLSYAQSLHIIDDIYSTRGILNLCIQAEKKRIKSINGLLSEVHQSTLDNESNVFRQQLLEQKQSSQRKLVTWFSLDYFLSKKLPASRALVSKTDFYNLAIKFPPLWRDSDFKLPPLTFDKVIFYDTLGFNQLSTREIVFLCLLTVVSLGGASLCYCLRHRLKFFYQHSPARWGLWSFLILLPFLLVVTAAKIHYLNLNMSVGLIDIFFWTEFVALVFLLVHLDGSLNKQQQYYPRLPEIYTWVVWGITILYNWAVVPTWYHSNTTPLILLTLRQFSLFVVGILCIVLLISRRRNTPHEPLIRTILTRLTWFSGSYLLTYIAFTCVNYQWPAELYFIWAKTIGISLYIISLIVISMPMWDIFCGANRAALRFCKGAWYAFGAINLSLLYNGYHRLVLFLILNLFIIFGMFYMLRSIYHVLVSVYNKIITPSSLWNKKMHYLLGIDPKGAFELVIAKYAVMLPALYMSIFILMELWGSSIYKVQEFASAVQHGFLLFDTHIYFSRIVRAILLTLLGLLLSRIGATYIMRSIKFKTESAHTRQLVRVLLMGLFLFVAMLIGLVISGIDVTSIVVFSGAISIGLGFGLQSFARDLVAGFTLLSNQSIKLGDYIQVMERGKLVGEGIVEKIAFLSSTLSLNGVKSYIPNSKLTSEAVIDFETSYFKQLHLFLLFEDAAHAGKAIDTIKEQVKTQPGLLLHRPYQPTVRRVANQLELTGRLKQEEDEEQVLVLWEKNLRALAKKKQLKYKITRSQ